MSHENKEAEVVEVEAEKREAEGGARERKETALYFDS